MSIHSNQDPNQDPYGYGGYSGGYSSPSQNQSSSQDPYGEYANQETGGQQQQQQQQQRVYQPPRSVTARHQAYTSSASGMSGRKAAVWSYALGPFSGIYFLLKERTNQFVRFAAAQSTVFSLSVLIIYLILTLIPSIPVLGFLLGPFLACVTPLFLGVSVLLWILLMFTSYRGSQFRIPFLADFAERLAGRRR